MKLVKSSSLARLLALSLLVTVYAAPARAATTLEMAYMPIVPCSQLFVMEGMGWTKEAGINLKLTRFPNGPAIVQAIASGKMDLMCFGIGPAMVSRAKGIKIKVIATGIVEQIAVIAQGDLVKYFNKYPQKEALVRFAKDKGRKVKLASFPKGSVPDTVTRHWLIKMLGMSVDDVELIGMGASRVQQALLSRSVDAAGILEPILTIVASKLPDAKVVVRANGMMPRQPGSTLAARENIIEQHRAAIVKLVELHTRATKLLLEQPEKAAPHVTKFIAKGLVDEATILKAISSPSSNFRANPRDIIESTKYMSSFQYQYKIQSKKVNTDNLFDTTVYDAAIAGMSK
ncbi:MAG: ABC transporter substrate-binding protein [Betaproteobacteria bacterium]|nr:ABC transporter substrate-binding protein [Betaproteobacteria bacterium]MDH3436963.1 ABC transporter substrate-binding protein [Betaproteobacteria bacterium]